MIRWLNNVPKKWAYTTAAVVAVAVVAGTGYSVLFSDKTDAAQPTQASQPAQGAQQPAQGGAQQPAAGAGQAPRPAGNARQFPVETKKVEMSEVSGGQVFSGSITPSFTTNVSARVTGRVTEIMVKVGDRVKEGQPIAKLDTTTLEQQIVQSRSDLAVTTAQFNRAVTDQENSATAARKQFEQQKATYERTVQDNQNTIATLTQSVATSQANYNKAVSDQQNAIASAKQTVALTQQTLNNALATYNTNLTNALNALSTAQDTTQTSQVSTGNTISSLQLALQQAISSYQNAGTAAAKETALQKVQSAQLALDQQQQTTPKAVTDAQNALLKAQNDLAAAQNSQTVLVAQEQLNRDMISLNNAQNTMNVSLEQSQQQLKAAQLALNNALNGQDTTLEVSRAQLAYQEQTMQNSQSTEAVKVSLAQLEQAQNRLKTLEQQLADTTVLAPVDGVVTVINTPVGQNATGQGNLMTIASLNPLQALVNVSESNIGKLKVGQRMKVTVPTIGKSYDGVINAIRPTLDSVTKSYGVEIRVSDPKQELLPGMFASSSLTNEGRKAIMVPADAVISQPSGNAVFIVKDGRASRVSVKVGTLTSAMIEITSGLKEGDELIVKGQELLSDKAVVQVVEPGQNQAKPNQNQNQAKPNQNQNQAKPNQNQNQAKPNQNQQNQNQQNRQPANAPAQTTPPAQGTAPAQTTTPANGAGNAQGAGAGQ